jgi:anti-sigma regulatory factor (Ser/Thr protein kinase)
VNPNGAPPQLALRSDLSELMRVVVWLDDLAAYFQIPQATHYAMDLCLEEALSNIIRHGYAGEDGTIVVRHRGHGEGELLLVVEDGAAAFDPLAPELPPSLGWEDSQAEGFGIELMRRFASAVKYERLASGNRLTLYFSWH